MFSKTPKQNGMKSIFTTKMFKNLSFTLLAFLSVLVSSAQTTFNYTGGMQTYVVPLGVTSIQIETWGAQGGTYGGIGGLGGYSQGILAVTPGQNLNVFVGGQGINGGPGLGIIAGGYNGGGFTYGDASSGSYASSGGGASDVRTGGMTLVDRVIVAGGGGGGGQYSINPNGGAGGGLTGTTGVSNFGYTGGGGGSQVSGGAAGSSSSYSQVGTLGQGGNQTGSTGGWNGSAGGGGYYGGGSGGALGAGGGGGSSYIGGVTSGSTLAGVRSGNGQVIITPLVSCVPTFLNPVGALPDLTNACSVAAPVAPTTTNDCGDLVTGTTSTSFPITTQGTTVVTWNFDDGQGNTTTQTQNVIIDDITAPVVGYGTGTLADPFTTTSASVLAAYPSGLFYFYINGSTFQASVDNTTTGGGWILVLNYVHQGGTNPALNVRTSDLPIQTGAALGANEGGTAAWGHAGNALLTSLNPTELRFYGQSSGHGRVINFVTNYANAANYAMTGTGSMSGINNPVNYTLLPGHTANIPQNAPDVWTDQGDYAMTAFPFWLSGTFHWGIQGSGNRWEVDDFPGNESLSTIHRVWGRNTNPPTVQPIPPVLAECSATPATPTATDNCAGIVNGVPNVTFPITTPGTTVVTWTFDDGNGNTSTQTQNVIISDVLAPFPGSSLFPAAPASALLNVPEAANYQLVYELNIDNTTSYANGANYSVNNSSVVGSNHTRVAYYMELDGQWVWVSMNDFAAGNLGALAIPNITTNNVVWDQNVANMNVSSNVGGIVNGSGITTGNIEMWRFDYGTTGNNGIGGNDGLYDFDDMDNGTSVFGSFQVNNYGAGQTLFALNQFNQTGNKDLGIGNSPIGQPDWTFRANSNTYGTKKLYVLVNNTAAPATLPALSAECSITPVTPTATDNCAGIVNGVPDVAFPITTQGTTVVTWTYDDGNGNTSSQTQNVVLNDVTAPVINCPGNISVSNDPGVCGSVVSYIVPVGTDNCLGALTAQTDLSGLTSGSTFPIGTTTLEYTVTDAVGLTDVCSFTVTVADNDAPVAICQNLTVNLDVTGSVSVLANAINLGSNDECGIALLQINGAASQTYTCSNVGTNTAVLTVVDNNSNVSTCNSTITVLDVTPPIALCNNITLPLNASGNASVTVAMIDAGSSDACGLAGLSVTPNNYTCANLGANTLTLLVEDNNGNTTTCTSTITVIDNIAPTALCKPVTLNLDLTGNATLTSAAVNNSSLDNCGIASMTLSQTAFTCADVVTNPNSVTMTVMDNAGNSSTCTSAITVVDNIPPTAICQNISVNLNAGGTATVLASAIDNLSSDACGIALIQINGAASQVYTCANVGANTATLTVIDDNSNTSTCTSTITVIDNIAPTAICQPFTIALNASGNATITASDINNGSSDNCSIASMTVSPSTFTCANVGPNNVTLTVTDASGNTSTCVAVVTVQDNTVPVVSCPSNITQNAILNNCGKIVSYTVGVTDNCSTVTQTDGSGLTSGSLFPVGVTTQSYNITDAGGNTVTCSFTVTILDIQNPTITGCPANIVVSNTPNNCNANVFWTAPTASDNCSGVVLTSNVLPGSNFPIGTTPVTYTATDASGRTTTCTFTVTVNDTQLPTITCPAAIAANTDAGQCYATVSLGSPVTGDNCGVATLTNNAPATFPVGSTTVTWTVTDVNGNINTCNQVVIVTDIVNPVAVCQNVNVNLDVTGNGSTTAALVNNGSSDVCGIASMTLSQTAFTCSQVGVNPVTLTVVDNNGNTSTCAADVTVIDNIAPAAVCQNISINLDATGNASITAAMIDNGSSDACGISLSASQTTFDCSNVGPNSVVLTVTDVNGNSSTCTSIVTVVDNTAPVAVCQNITLQLDASGNATITGSMINNGSSDACGIASLSVLPNTFTCANIGSNTVVLTVMDINGNSSTCNATVTIQDNIAPIAVCQNVTVTLDVTGNGTTTAALVDNGSTDACGIASLALSQTTFTCADISTNPNQVTLTVVDNNGNSSTCNADVTVIDNIAPIAVCSPITVSLDALGTASITPVSIDGGSSDACGVLLSASTTSFTCADLGANNVTLTVTDPSMNSSTCIALVTVQDIIAPIIACQNLTVQLDATGNATIVPADITTSATDNCSIASSTIDVSTFDCTNVGTPVIVTLSVTDQSGNTSTCTSTVTVQDNIAPVAVCQNVTVTLDVTGNGSTTAALVNNGSTDACGIASLTLSQTAFNCSEVGVNPVTLTVVDVNGNSSTCAADVTVIDNIAPVAVCQDITVQLDALGQVTIVPSDIDGGSSDACTPIALSFANSSTSGFTAGFAPSNWTFSSNGGDGSYSFGGTSSLTLVGSNNGVGAITSLCSTVPQNGTISFNWNYSTVDGPNWDPSGYQLNGAFVQLTNPSGGQIQNGTVNIPVIAGDQFCFNQNSVDGVVGAGITISSLFVFSADGNQMTFDCSEVGVNAVPLYVTDPSGNVSTCTANVTVEDNIAPIIACQNITVQLDATGNASIVPANITASATDNCAIATSSIDVSTFTCANIGPNTVVLTVTDVNGNVSTCNATVTVEDNIAPVAVCQNVTVTLDVTGNGSTTAALVNNGSTDACGIASMTLSQTAFTCADITTNPNQVTLTVIDNNGNSSTCTADVTVIDNIAPNAVCQNITIQLDGSGNASIVATDIDGGSTDACGIATYVASQTAFDCSNIGTNNVILTLTDVNGNTSTCTAIVTVVDLFAPVIVCPGDVLVSNDPGLCTASNVDYGTATATDNCSGVVITNNAPSVFPFGPTNVTWTATDIYGNTSVCIQIVTVQDVENPTITCPSNLTVSADAGVCDATGVVLGTATATDNCTIATITNNAPATFPMGVTMVTWTATDVQGNTSSCSQFVTVIDTEVPVIACPADITVPALFGSCEALGVVLGTPTTSDNCTVATVTNNAPVNYPLGTTIVTWTVTDAAGNSSTCTQNVTVTDTQLPVIACPSAVSVPADLGVCSATGVVIGTPVTSDNCSILSVTNNAPLSFGLGNTIVTWTIVDGSTNTATCTQTVTVLDTQVPTITCPTAVTVAADLGSCTATAVVLGTPLTNDNCSIASTTNNAPLAFPLGATTVTWTVVDGSGNTATCSQTVTVIDTQLPTITCPIAMTVPADAGLCTASSVALGTPLTTDNCSVASVTNNAPALFPLGNTTVTWTVVDGSGNVATCTQIITVIDTQLPVIACPTNVTIPADLGTCTAIAVSLGSPTTSDNCSIASVSNNGLAVYPLGNTTVTWTVLDGSGNSATCTQTITVIDTQLPTISCPVAVTVPSNPGVCTASGVVLGSPITNDNCSVASVTNNAPATYPLGNTTVTWTVTDGSGNVSTCSQTVTVVDTQAPIVTCPPAVNVNANLGTCNATGVVLGSPTVTDNCTVASITNNAPAVYPLGVTTVIWTVVDGSGNTTYCTQFVTVTDTQVPTIACSANVTVPAGAGSCVATGVVLTTPATADNCSVASVTNNAPSAYPLGNTTVTWTVTDGSGNTATCNQIVTVVDTQLPTINCPANVVIAANMGSCVATSVVLGTPVTADNCSVASVTNNAPSTYPLGTTNVTWTVVDGSGNIQTCIQTVTVEDTQAPTIVCPSNVTVSAAGGMCSATSVALGTPITADNCSVASVTNNAPTTFNLGATIVTWTVVDGSGNVATCNQTVTVVDNQNPIIACPFPVAATTDLGSCNATGVVLGTPTTADNCSVASITNNAPLAFAIGTTTVVWTVTDGSGNTATCAQTVTVTDIELPTISCPVNVTVAAATGACTVTGVVLGSPVTADNCSVATISNNAPAVYGLGTTNVTWTVVDASGNSATCIQTVTVIDTQLPTIVCPTNITVQANSGSCLASGVVLGTPTTADNCSVASVTSNAPASYPLGNTTVTWTVVDGSGNTATCTQLITVIDTQVPTIVCAAPLTVNTDAGSCGATLTLITPSTADNCSVASVTSNAPSTFPLGTTVVTWTVVDGSGNIATCNQTVIVVDNELPTIACQADITLNNLPGFCGRSVNYATPSFADNCSVASFTQTDGSGYISGDLFPIGTTYQEFTVVDNSGNSYTCGFNITIVDNEVPVMNNCPSDIVAFINQAGQCEQNVTWQNPTASDNCPGIDLTQNYYPGNSFPIGTTVVTYTATDNAGNTVSCSFSVTVIDQANPIVTVVGGTKLTVNVSGATYQWVDCNNNYAPIAGATNQMFTPAVSGNYAVVVNTGGCPDTSNCESITVSGVGIEEIAFNDVVLYPNPTLDGSFKVTFDGVIDAIMVYDMTGREVAVDVDLNNKSVNGSQLASGKYMVRIITENKLITKELVVVNVE